MGSTRVLSDSIVRHCVRGYASFFDSYQKDIVGAFSSLSEYPESDVEVEVSHALEEKADFVDVIGDITASHEEPDCTDVVWDEEETCVAVVHRPLPLEAVFDAGFGWDRFAMVWVGNPLKLHLSAMFYNKEDHGLLGLIGQRSDAVATVFLLNRNFLFFFKTCCS